MKEYRILNVKVQTLPRHIVKQLLRTFLQSDNQHQVVTVNPEFVVGAQKDKKFLNVINEASLATIDGAGIIKAIQTMGHKVTLDDRMTGVSLSKILIKFSVANNHKILFLLNEYGLTNPDNFFIGIKEKYPQLDFQVATESTAQEKCDIFKPDILLVGFGAPYQDMWIYENINKLPSVKIAVGVGGTFDFLSGTIKRAPKIIRSLGMEWFWRLLCRPKPHRIIRIYKAVVIFPFLIFKNRYVKNKN